jgi:AcrR family transcriptional regulator
MPNRASELAWEDEDQPAAGGLSRHAVVQAAVAIADAEGIAAVSIRRVAARLGARPMSLYTYIASKDDLLDLMIDEVVGDVLVPEPLPEDWRDALTEIARRSHDGFVAHSWALAAFGNRVRTRVGPNVQRHAEQSFAALAVLDLSHKDARSVLEIVDDYTIGHALRVVILGDAQPFEAGLETVLDGIEQRFLS